MQKPAGRGLLHIRRSSDPGRAQRIALELLGELVQRLDTAAFGLLTHWRTAASISWPLLLVRVQICCSARRFS